MKTECSPKGRAALAIRDDKAIPSEQIAEFVDNIFDPARGNASQADFTYDNDTGTLTIVDDGRGMDDIRAIFTLGDGTTKREGGIGFFNSGGTRAMIWLSRVSRVWSVREDGQLMAFGEADWQDVINHGWPEIDGEYKRARPGIIPAQLWSRPSGTMIRLTLWPKRRFSKKNVDAIIAQLGRTFSSGLRNGLTITWNGQNLQPWTPPELTDRREKEIVLGNGLSATLRAGLSEKLTAEESKLCVSYGHRLIMKTRDAFGGYAGANVYAELDLSPGWLEHLTTNKNEINDAPLREKLMAAVYEELKDILQYLSELKKSALTIRLQGLVGQAVKDLTNERPIPFPNSDQWAQARSGPVGPVKEGDKSEPNKGKIDESRDNKPAKETIIRVILEDNDDKMPGRLCRVEWQHGSPITACLDESHEVVKEASQKKPANEILLSMIILQELALYMVENGIVETCGLFKRPEIEAIQEKHAGQTQAIIISYVVRKLLGRVDHP